MKRFLVFLLVVVGPMIGFGQTLRTTINGGILSQGNKGITATKLNNVLVTVADSVSSKANKSGGVFSGTITAPSFVRAGGTSLQFLKADGSVDASAFAILGNNNVFTGTNTFRAVSALSYSSTTGANFATSSGSVGIGTVSPQNLIHIKGTPSVGVGVRNSHLIIESTETAAVDVGAVLKFAGQSGNTVNPYSFGTIEAKKESALTNNYSSFLAFHTIDNIGGSTERMRINGSGNIGIGTIGPLYKLHILGGNVYIGGTGAGLRLEDRSLSSRSFQFYVDGGALAFFNHNNSTQPLTITDGGNVLIGTVTNSGYKLDVSGTAQATQFKLSALNTAPASATATGVVGEIRIDASYIYICTATNTWKRSALTTW
jgi:hypothetical protein